MNAINLAQRAYAPASAAAIRSGRSVEHQLFSQITARIKEASDKGNFAKLVAALHENRQLWTLLAVDVADDGNALPQALRAQIFYLAEFTAQHTSKVLRQETDASALIEINRAIMAGLAGQAGTQ